MLTDAVNFRPLQPLQLAGSKATERLRGNGLVLEWVNSTFDWNSYVQGFGNYHNKMSEDEDNTGRLKGWQQRVELRQHPCANRYQTNRADECDMTYLN